MSLCSIQHVHVKATSWDDDDRMQIDREPGPMYVQVREDGAG